MTGGVDKGETHEQAARREMAEEVGLRALALTQVLREPVEMHGASNDVIVFLACLLYTSPSPRDATLSRMPSSA